jgi:hypothetical protein
VTTFTHTDIVAWATDLPTWIQDALRLLLEKGALDQTDIAALVVLAKQPYLGSSPAMPYVPQATPVEETEEAIKAVSLKAVRDIARVNALAEGPILFNAEGLSVIYGDNACGKSSLARILKKACRSLVPGGPILPSIEDLGGTGSAQATVEFVLEGSLNSVTWIDGQRISGPLDFVNIFDAACAREQVSSKNEISYKPAILRVFETLVGACTQVSSMLQAEQHTISHSLVTIILQTSHQ